MINTLVEQDFIDSAFRPEYLLKALFIVTVDRSNVIKTYFKLETSQPR